MVESDERPSVKGRARLLNVGPRILPRFLIVGAMKSGTSSLYWNLCRQNNVLAASRKELHYFADGYTRGWSWYRQQFPTRLLALAVALRERCRIITGEASPYYLFHPKTAARVRRHLPRVKLIALLRNPVDRAYSHYQHTVRNDRETLSFEEAIDHEAERLDGERERLLADDGYVSPAYSAYSYLARGVYADQLETWLREFPREQLLVLRAEDLFERSQETLLLVNRFLQLMPKHLFELGTENTGGYESSIPPQLRPRLVEYFRPHNERLRSFVDWDPDWDR
jgi:hypothetical protein